MEYANMRHETEFPVISREDLARLGAGHVAYLRRLTGDEISQTFPNVKEVEAEATVWALFGADGTPLAIADDAGAALSTAFSNNLTPVAVH